jgi:hypothetical protein
MSANKIKKPILLIHGEEDNNSGTLTMQVFIYIYIKFMVLTSCADYINLIGLSISRNYSIFYILTS